jgi:2-keto-3-deoxy-L-rhamnonate aldolase RhmA
MKMYSNCSIGNEMKVILITNDPVLASHAESAGVDRVMVDLEIIGKIKRQRNLDTLISNHTLSDISDIRPCLSKTELMVRINPLNPGSRHEIDQVIALGADRIMLPMVRRSVEVASVLEFINGRVPLTLLVETAAALTRLTNILAIPGIDDVHIGLNDLHIDLGLDSMFELFPSGLLDFAAHQIIKASKSFGIGGVARLGEGKIPASLILSEHQRLGSTRVILSRSFMSGLDSASPSFGHEIARIKKFCQLPLMNHDVSRGHFQVALKALNNS